MQFAEAQNLKKRNIYNCSHHDIEKEYILGSHTGDYVCTTCGEAFFSKDEWKKTHSLLIKRVKEKETVHQDKESDPPSKGIF